MKKLLLYYHTLKHLKAVQIYGRLWFLLYRPRPDTRPAPLRRPINAPAAPVCPRPSSMTGPDEFIFLNRCAAVTSRADWNSPELSRLWLYNLHYFDDLNAADAEKRISWHRELIRRWIEQNPPGCGTGWEPYPTSLRIVNWIKWLLRGNSPVDGMTDSLAVQARWLGKRLEYHLLGNHLLANAKVLVFAGLFFQGREAEVLYQKGRKILDNEISEQILADGGHFERSPMYQLLVMEDLLDLINIHRAYDTTFPERWPEIARQMLCWSHVMRHPDGEIPFFNDAAFEVAPDPSNLDKYAKRLGIEPSDLGGPGIRHLEKSGYVRLEKEAAVLLADIGPVGPDYLPGHAHADTLSFELSIGGRRAIVNGGTSEYGTGAERQRQRSTAAHSTVMVDGENSSEVWGGFRVARRAHITEAFAGQEDDVLCAGGGHDGFRRLAGSPLHRRKWLLRDNDLKIIDQISGSGLHRADIIFILAPDLLPVASDNRGVEIREHATGKGVFDLRCESDIVSLFIEPDFYCPRFGKSMKTWRIRLCIECGLPVTHETILSWNNKA